MKGIPREVEDQKKHRITNSQAIRSLRDNFFLNSEQKSVLIGTLLGDGSLSKNGWAKNYRLNMIQGDAQKEYLFWKFQLFRNACCSEPSYQKWNRSWLIRTISHSAFNNYAETFYAGGKKIIPRTIAQFLDPLALAVWFMDDGALGGRGEGYILNTQSFSYKENEVLRLGLQERFSAKVSIHKDKKWWRLYIWKGSMDNFRNIIDPYVIPAIRYKLYAFDPVETTRGLSTKVEMKI